MSTLATTDSGVGGHGLDEARALHEEHKNRWTVIVREHLNRTLVTTGFVSAEDFDALGVPPEHSNLANAQMGAYSRAGFMEKVSWRRSTKPSRKSGTIWTHRITEKGRAELSKLVGSSADNHPAANLGGSQGGGSGEPVSVTSGENSSAGVPDSSNPGGDSLPTGAGAGVPDSSESSTLSLLPEPPRPGLIDPDQRAA